LCFVTGSCYVASLNSRSSCVSAGITDKQQWDIFFLIGIHLPFQSASTRRNTHLFGLGKGIHKKEKKSTLLRKWRLRLMLYGAASGIPRLPGCKRG
jgi:hypothetical protein